MGCLSFLFPLTLGSAELVVIQPNSAQTGRRIAIKFILRSYKLFKQNIYAEQSIPGLPGAPLQFLRGQPKHLSVVMYFDARSQNRDVRELADDVAHLMKVDPAPHAPPVLRFEWKGRSLQCVLESVTEEIISLFPDGRPARAKMHATFKEMRTLVELQEELARERGKRRMLQLGRPKCSELTSWNSRERPPEVLTRAVLEGLNRDCARCCRGCGAATICRVHGSTTAMASGFNWRRREQWLLPHASSVL